VAVNSLYGRTQDLLHLHVDCLRVDVRDELRRSGPRIGYAWSRRHTLTLAGQPYHVIRIDGEDIAGLDPFRRLAEGMGVPRGQMGAWTLVLAGATFEGGKPGFFLAAGRADPARGDNGSGEDLQDHDCAGRGVSSAAKAAI
jgi:CDP-diacylglycerol pyrophosphatase